MNNMESVKSIYLDYNLKSGKFAARCDLYIHVLQCFEAEHSLLDLHAADVFKLQVSGL